MEKTLAEARAEADRRERAAHQQTLQGSQRSEPSLSYSHVAAATARHRRNAGLLQQLL